MQDAINNYYEETRKIVGDNVSQEEILKKVSGLNENDILFQKIIGREIRIPLAKKMIRYKIVN